MNNIIGLGHRARQGKDTAAGYLSSKYKYVHLSFAKALYDEVMDCDKDLIHYWIREKELYVWDCNIGEYGPVDINRVNPGLISGIILKNGIYDPGVPDSPILRVPVMVEKDRDLLQWWGTEYRRNLYDSGYWLQKLHELMIDIDGPVVISDVRYPNEADFIKKLGGTMINIKGRAAAEMSDVHNAHISETAMDCYDYDYYIINSGTINDLHRAIDDVLPAALKA